MVSVAHGHRWRLIDTGWPRIVGSLRGRVSRVRVGKPLLSAFRTLVVVPQAIGLAAARNRDGEQTSHASGLGCHELLHPD